MASAEGMPAPASGSAKSVSVQIGELNQSRLEQFNAVFFPWLKRSLFVMLVVTLLMLLVMGALFVISCYAQSGAGKTTKDQIAMFHFAEKAFLHTVQIGLGFLLGLICLVVGAILCWFGITGTLSLEAGAPKGGLKLNSEVVGTVLLLGGILILYAAVTKQVTTTSVDKLLLEEAPPLAGAKTASSGEEFPPSEKARAK